MENETSVPKSQRIFGNIVYIIAIISALGALIVPIFILASPDNNVLNPNIVFGVIFDGSAPSEIWEHSVTGAFAGSHFYLSYLNKADSWAMIFVVFGSLFGLIALMPTVIYQMFKEKDLFCAFFGIVIIALILFSVMNP